MRPPSIVVAHEADSLPCVLLSGQNAIADFLSAPSIFDLRIRTSLAYVYSVMIDRFVGLNHVSTSISFDMYTAIIRTSLSFQPPRTEEKRTTREATQPIIFAAPLPSSHLFPFARARARSLARVVGGCIAGKNSLVPHLFFFFLVVMTAHIKNRPVLDAFFLLLLLLLSFLVRPVSEWVSASRNSARTHRRAREKPSSACKDARVNTPHEIRPARSSNCTNEE